MAINAHPSPPRLPEQEDRDLLRGQLEPEKFNGGRSHTRGMPCTSPVQGLLLHDVFKHMLVFLPEAAKLIAGAELVSSRAGELDVKGRGRKVNLRDDISKVRRENSNWVGLPPTWGSNSLLPASIPASLPPHQNLCKITLLDLVTTTVPSSYNLQQKNETETERQKEKWSSEEEIGLRSL